MDNNMTDHDLLVKLNERVSSMRDDIKSLADNTTKRVDALELGKLDIKDSYVVVYKAAIDASLLDHEKRLRTNERNLTKVIAYGSVIIAAIEIAAKYFFH